MNQDLIIMIVLAIALIILGAFLVSWERKYKKKAKMDELDYYDNQFVLKGEKLKENMEAIKGHTPKLQEKYEQAVARGDGKVASIWKERINMNNATVDVISDLDKKLELTRLEITLRKALLDIP